MMGLIRFSAGYLLFQMAGAMHQQCVAQISAFTLVWSKSMPSLYVSKQWDAHAAPYFPDIFFDTEGAPTWYQMKEYPDEISRREPPREGRSRYMLDVLRLSLNDGTTLAEHELTTNAYSSLWEGTPKPGALFPTKGGLVQSTGQLLRFYSGSDYRFLKEVRWSDVRDDKPGDATVSVSRDGVMVVADFKTWGLWVQCNYDGRTFDLISQQVMARTPTEHDGDWKTADKSQNSAVARQALDLVDGVDKRDQIMEIENSLDHTVCAGILATRVGSAPTLDIYGHLKNFRYVVIDTQSKKLLGSIPFSNEKGMVHRIELSPNGQFVLTLDGRVLRLYALGAKGMPAPGTPPSAS
jgi:hypothetical protein